MDQDMDLTIRSLNFRIGSLGSIRLSDPVKLGPSASKSKTEAMSESSEGSSSEVNSLVSSMEIEAEKREFAEGDETMGNFDLEVQLEDLMISRDDTSDKSTDTWQTGLDFRRKKTQSFQASIVYSTIGTKYSLLQKTTQKSSTKTTIQYSTQQT
jgi:hypothetical protein